MSPVPIPYKGVEVELAWVQARRILCEFSREPFVYICHGIAEAESTGMIAFDNYDKLQQVALANGKDMLFDLAEGDQLGTVLCPCCGRYQSWMLDAIRVGQAMLGGCLLFDQATDPS